MSTGARGLTTVFVVEEDESVRTGLSRLLQAEGFSVRLFDTAEAFLAGLSSLPSSCVLLELPMAHVGALEARRRLDQLDARLPVIAVTASDDAGTRRDARQLGAMLYLRKPIDDRTLVDAIDWVVRTDPAPPRTE